jgi:hypothetical protein
MNRDEYEKGKQPCNRFKPSNEDPFLRGNVHSCIYCDDSTVSFCENCCFDHHINGYETCKKQVSDEK